MFWAIHKVDFFIFGCEKLYIGTDQKPLLEFFRKNYSKPLDQIVNKCLRKFVSEINEIRITIFTFLVYFFFRPWNQISR